MVPSGRKPAKRLRTEEEQPRRLFCRKTNFVASELRRGAIAQLVEQRTENPCVPSSILGGTTKERLNGLFFAYTTLRTTCADVPHPE